MKYKVTKYAQSCFLIEKDGKRLLIDPGRFVYEMDSIQPRDWPKIDVILVTHEHADHAYVEGIRFLVERDRCPVYTNASFAAVLADDRVSAKDFTPGQNETEAGFVIHGVRQRHGDLPDGRPTPEDVGFLIDGSTFYHPGDSVTLPTMPHADVMFVPVAGPQMNFETAKQMIVIVEPKLAIPMHYANVKKYPIDMDELRVLQVPGTEVLVLEDKQSFSWPQE